MRIITSEAASHTPSSPDTLPNPLAVAVDQIAQTLPVNRAGGLAAVEFLVVDDGFDGEEICRRLHHPFDPGKWLA